MADLTTVSTGSTVETVLPFTTPTAFAIAGPASAFGGLTSGGLYSFAGSETTPVGKAYNYTLVIQIPIPWFSLNLDLNLIGDFVLPALSALGVPQAIQYLSNNIVGITQNIVNAAVKLIKAIPEATVTILVKVGPVVVLNVVLVAQKVPVVVPVPTFQLSLPDFAVDANFNLTIPFPVPPPIYVYIPVPVPVIAWPTSFVAITGGNVSATAGGSAGVGSTFGTSGGVVAASGPEPAFSSVYFPDL